MHTQLHTQFHIRRLTQIQITIQPHRSLITLAWSQIRAGLTRH